MTTYTVPPLPRHTDAARRTLTAKYRDAALVTDAAVARLAQELAATECFVCANPPHADNASHGYWSTLDALTEARDHDAKVRLAETPEARYVRQHRPY